MPKGACGSGWNLDCQAGRDVYVRSGVAAVLYKGMILVLGGELPPNHTFPENESYDPASDRWVALAPMPAGRHGFGGAVIGSNAYFVGGSLTPGGGGITDQLIMFSLP